MKVKQDLVLIVMSINTKAPKLVFPWERMVFEEKFGKGSVEFVESYVTEVSELPDAEEEFARLDRVFGRNEENKEPHIERAFGRGKAGTVELLKVMKKAVVKARKTKTAKSPEDKPEKTKAPKVKEPESEKVKSSKDNAKSSSARDPFDK